jgi:hypothetical protein
MWTCPECSRSFRRNKQHHICVQKDPYDLVEGKPDNVLLAFDTLMTRLLEWEGCGVDASKIPCCSTSTCASGSSSGR